MVKHIVLITTSQPSVNPRIVKEANTLEQAGYEVTVLYCFYIGWAMAADIEFLKTVKWNYKLIGGSPINKKWQYIFTTWRLKANRFLHKRFGNKWLIAERSQTRCYDELLKAGKSIKADWYIGHNLGALPIVVNSARFHKAKCGFDFEDYHRGEYENILLKEDSIQVYLENKYVPDLQYFSTSSWGITAISKTHFPLYQGETITLLNCFPLSNQPVFKKKAEEDNTLQLFWFSQTIGKKRGLEVLIDALNKLNDLTIHLSLAGNCNEDFYEYVKDHSGNIKNNIHFVGIIPPHNLSAYCSCFDVGLALETGFSVNNSLALSNKIFTYLLAGNAVIISKTEMQKEFSEEYRIGETFEINDCNGLTKKILFYKNKQVLENQRRHNYELAKNILNWENESKKLLAVID